MNIPGIAVPWLRLSRNIATNTTNVPVSTWRQCLSYLPQRRRCVRTRVGTFKTCSNGSGANQSNSYVFCSKTGLRSPQTLAPVFPTNTRPTYYQVYNCTSIPASVQVAGSLSRMNVRSLYGPTGIDTCLLIRPLPLPLCE